MHRSVTLQNYTVVLHTKSEEESCASFSLTLKELVSLSHFIPNNFNHDDIAYFPP